MKTGVDLLAALAGERPERLKHVRHALEQVAQLRDGVGLEVDDGIAPLVASLGLSGFCTMGSCEGHLDHGGGYPWVDLDVTVTTMSLSDLESLLTRFSEDEPGLTVFSTTQLGGEHRVHPEGVDVIGHIKRPSTPTATASQLEQWQNDCFALAVWLCREPWPHLTLDP